MNLLDISAYRLAGGIALCSAYFARASRLFKDNLPKQNYMLTAVDMVLLALAGGVVVQVVKNFSRQQPAANV